MPTLPRRLIVVAAALLAALPALAQKKKLSIEDLSADPPLSGRAVSGLAWLPDGSRFSYLVTKGVAESAAAELWVEEAASGKKSLAVASSALVVPAASASPGIASAKPRTLPLDGYAWSPDATSLLLSGEGDLWLYGVGSGKLERLTSGPEQEEFPTFSPDGRRVAFVRRSDLYALELATKAETRLTRDGGDHVFNGRLDWVYEEELASRTGHSYEWAPDGGSIAYLSLDENRVSASPIVDFLPVPASVEMQRYPEAGSRNPIPSFHVVGVDGAPLGDVTFGDGDVYVVPAFSWTADSKSVCYRVLNRAQNRQEVALYTPSQKASRTLFVEEDPFWINVVEPPRFLSGGRFLWASERTGFKHLYLGDLRDGSVEPVTRGPWMVDQVVGVDEGRGIVYFTSTAADARRRPVYRVGLSGGEPAKIAAAPGTHTARLSKNGKHLLDTFSSTGQPPVVSLLEASGRLVRVVDRPENRLSEYDLATTENVEVRAADGTTLYAHLVKPSDFDASKKYPVLVSVYGGPHAQLVTDGWGATPLLHHLLAERGILVWTLDNRGSAGRGHAFETPIFLETGRRELADQLEGVRYLTSLPYVDGARIAVYGGSYGGYMTLYSLTSAPDVWRCGIAAAPVTHWKFYDSIYTERYMRTPAQNPKGYEDSAPLTKAKQLRAPLLLIHGTADDNVHLQNTVAFVDALTKAGIPYALQVQAGQKHGFHGKPARDFLNATIVEFLEKNLK